MPGLNVGALFDAAVPADLAATIDGELADSSLPLALLPVRLETRFFPGENGTTELRVRVYPDKVHINSHDPSLTPDELESGQRFWEAEWRAGDDDTRRRDAWRELADRLRPERAAWVARSLAPTNPGDRPTGPVDTLTKAPQFPAPDSTSGFRPRACLMPARWTCTAYADGSVIGVATGNDIVRDPFIAPDLEGKLMSGQLDHEAPAIDVDMAWMVDFDLAEAAGMAVRMKLPGPIESSGIDLLLVVGVRDGDAGADLRRQLDAHHYTDGLAFVPAGTASNNAEDERAGYRRPDPRHEASFAHEWQAAPGPGSAADLAGKALGVDAFRTIAGADVNEDAAARAMITALWPSTWGYFLAQMIGFGGEFTMAGRDWARSHAIDYLRPGGPLPVIRCGRQPYGLLPVTSLGSWQPGPGKEASGRLANLLTGLRDRVWRPASEGVALVEPGVDATEVIAEILQNSALSTAFQVRNLVGEHFGRHLRALLGEDLDAIGFWTRLGELASAQAGNLGVNFDNPLTGVVFDDVARPVSTPLVGDPAKIAAIRDASDIEELAKAPVVASLLDALLRHSLLREHVEATARWLDSPAKPRAELIRDAELVNLPGQPITSTWSWQRAQTLDGKSAAEGVAGDAGLAEMHEALDGLSKLDAATLERHMSQVLDAAGHRLDPWITTLASQRLAELRENSPVGIVVGGYGWLENLRPSPAGQPMAELPQDEPGPLYLPPEDPGFIHAPSLNQASAAALLRNAHLAHGGRPEDPYAIELTSARVRLAKRLFAGVRQGQPLGAMLGYTFERNLHDAGLDTLVDDFRDKAPLPGAKTPEGLRRLVVDGLKLVERWQNDDDTEVRDFVNSLAEPAQSRARAIIAKLEGAVEAAADAINAEAAFQMVRGNVTRAAAALETISSGQAAPPDLAFMATPRTGVPITHRVAMFVAPTGNAEFPGWAPSSPRSDADPALAMWAGRLLGDATNVAAKVIVSEPGEADRTVEIPVSDLALAPIDLVWLTGGAGGEPAELINRVLDVARHMPGAVSPRASLRVDMSSKEQGQTSLRDLVEIANQAQRLLGGARPLTGADLQSATETPARGLDLDEFEKRVAAAEAKLAEVCDQLCEATSSGSGVREAMLAAAYFGVDGAVPGSDAEVDPGATLIQARTVIDQLNRRVAPAAEPPKDEPDDAARLERQLARLRNVFGPGFIALPRFVAANASDLAASRADSKALLGDDPLAPYSWLLKMERVRPALARMSRPLRASEILGNEERLGLAVAQYPHVKGRPWMGRTVFDGADGCISLVLQGAPGDLDGQLCGLLVDEWTEVVPSATETTGIAFQCNLPDSAAPQAILLAVPPVVGEPWRLGSLNRVLLETLDLAHLRAVSPGDLGSVAQYLPASYIAFNRNVDAVDAVSTNMRLLAP